MAFAKESWPFVAPAGIGAVLLAVLGMWPWALGLAVLALLLLLFFRIPRYTAEGPEDHLLSPADGKVLRIDRIDDPEIGPGSYDRVVIFLSVFNVHVQRAPTGGTIVSSRYREGRKLAAFAERAGDVNEQLLTVLERSNGDRIGIRQIAGLLARRVVTYLEIDQHIERGELIGLIKFGSRVDLLLPLGYDVQIAVGQRVREGRTVIAHAPPGKPS